MTVAVLGAGGLLGRYVVRELGKRARALGRGDCDVTVEADVVRATEGTAVIINCAGWTDVDGAEANLDATYRVNALGAENAAYAATAHGAKLVHVSTGFVFDGAEDRPYDEFDVAHPLSVYGRSKWAGEELARAACDRAFIVRLQSLYGHGGKNFASKLRSRLLERAPLSLDADRPAQPTWAGAVARQLVHLAATDRFGTYHAVCSGTTTWAGFAAAMAERLGVDPYWSEVKTAELVASATRPKNHVLARRMLELRGLDLMPTWGAALAEYMEEAGRG